MGEIVAIDLPLADSVLSVVAVVRYSSQLNTGFEFVGVPPGEADGDANVAGSNRAFFSPTRPL